MTSHPRLPAVGAVTLTAVLWGTTDTAATFAPQAGPLAIGAAALGIGGLLQALVAIPAMQRSVAGVSSRRGVLVLGALAVAVYPLAFYSSMHLAGVAVGTVVSLASAPLAAGVLERVVDGRRLGPWWSAAAALGVIGSVLLCAAKASAAPADAPALVAGITLGLIAGITYALYSWAAARLMTDGIERAAAMGWVFGIGGLLLVPVLLITGAPLLSSPQTVAVAAYMALVPMFLGYVLFGWGLARLGPSTATTITLIEPAVATMLAVLVVGERLSPVGWVGLALIALVVVVLACAPEAPHEERD